MGNVSGSNGIQQFDIHHHHMQLHHTTLLTDAIQQKQQEHEHANDYIKCGIAEPKNYSETLLNGNQRQHYTYFSNHDYESSSTLTTIATETTTTPTVTTATVMACVPNQTVQNHYFKRHQQQKQQQRYHLQQQKQNTTFHTRSLPLPHNDDCQTTRIMCMYSHKNLQQQKQQHLKVLPTTLNVHERPKLRSTKNGVILNAGGTISGRREQLLLLATATATPTTTTTTLCSTLPQQQQSNVKKLKDNEQFIYRRSSIMFNMTTTTAATTENQNTTTTTTTTTTNKTQKYQKKRKAPAIPTSTVATPTIPMKTKTTPAIAVTTAEKKKVQVDDNAFSLNNKMIKCHIGDHDETKPATTIAIIDKPLPYRRERSSNAILLRQRLPDAVPEQHQHQHRQSQRAIKQKSTITSKNLMPTFYFDVQRNATTTANITMTTSVKEFRDENDLLICVHPVLPRRQLQMPNFSPSAAWRNINSMQQHQSKLTQFPMAMRNEVPIKSNLPQEAKQQHQWPHRHVANMNDQHQNVANDIENKFNCFSSPQDINAIDIDKQQPQQNAHFNNTLVLRNKQFFGLYNFNSLQPLKHYFRQQCSISNDNINNDDDVIGDDDDVIDVDDENKKIVNGKITAMDDNWVLHRVAPIAPESTTTMRTTTTLTGNNETVNPTTTNTEMYSMTSLPTPTNTATLNSTTTSSHFGRNCKSIGYLIGSKHRIYLPTINAVTYDSSYLKRQQKQ